jgi:AbrB family looped-hinge helix DNA binding protein
MSKVTSKLQVTIPKAIADRLRIRPGDEVDWVVSSDGVRLIPRGATKPLLTAEERIALFDASRERQRQREAANPWTGEPPADRGWTREELYQELFEDCGRPR